MSLKCLRYNIPLNVENVGYFAFKIHSLQSMSIASNLNRSHVLASFVVI